MIPSNLNITSALPTASGAAKSGGNIATTKDQFLQLLLAQMKYQDPMEPQDASKFAEQMTQFGQLEQLFNLNSSVDNLVKSQASMERSQAVSMIGRSVQALGGAVKVDQGVAGKVGFYLSSPAETVTVEIKDLLGKTVRTLTYTNQPGGSSFLDFDGKNAQGTPLTDGTYKVSVKAESGNGSPIGAYSVMQGVVEGVDFSTGSPLLKVNGNLVSIENVFGIDAN